MENNSSTDPPIKRSHIFVFPIFLIRAILWIPAVILLHYFLRMEVRGKGNLSSVPNGRVIFAANHCSELDPYAFQYALSFPSKFIPLYFVSLTKKYYSFKKFGIRSVYYGGLFFRLMGAYPVYKGLNNYEKAFTHHISILEKNHPVLIFPEGGMKKRAEIGEAKPGFIYLAKKTNAIIVPVKIEGTHDLDFKMVFSRQRKMKITFGKPMHHSELPGNCNQIIEEELFFGAQKIMQLIKQL